MKKIVINGGKKLHGKVNISGSKNSTLAILASTVLFENKITLDNVPNVRDIQTMIRLLETLGKKIQYKTKNRIIIAGKVKKNIAPYNLVRTMRAGILVLGPLLTKFAKSKVSLPGGCAIGARPVDLHLDFLDNAGYQNEIKNGYVLSKQKYITKELVYRFKKISVGATVTAILNSCLLDRKTTLLNVAKEPEIKDLIIFLNTAGANIRFDKNRKIMIKGVGVLKSVSHKIMPDRIEVGTYIAASLITNSHILINGVDYESIKNIINLFKKMNAKIVLKNKEQIEVFPSNLRSVSFKTSPFPGFPTDMQAQIMAIMSTIKGTSKIKEEIFENRYMHVLELKRMGANITINKNTAKIIGVKKLYGAEVMATDLRASVSLVIAALAAHGRTVINRVYHLERGYEDLVKKLRMCGANIKIINV